jgi:hypothetical protein
VLRYNCFSIYMVELHSNYNPKLNLYPN